MWKEYMEKMDDFDRMVDTRIAVEISKMSEEQKNLTIGEMMAAQKKHQGDDGMEENDQSNIFEDSVIGKFQNLRGGLTAKSVRSTAKKSSRKPARMQRETPSTVRQSSRKQARTASDSSDTIELTSTVKMSSSRGGGLAAVPCTPINPAGAVMGLGMTPMITPKFNITTPLHHTARRGPKQNETLVSLNGSPVMGTAMKAAGRGKRKNQPEPLTDGIHIGGTNFSLQLPVAADIDVGGLELEDAHYEKLSIISQGINNLLRMRAASSTESD